MLCVVASWLNYLLDMQLKDFASFWKDLIYTYLLNINNWRWSIWIHTPKYFLCWCFSSLIFFAMCLCLQQSLSLSGSQTIFQDLMNSLITLSVRTLQSETSTQRTCLFCNYFLSVALRQCIFLCLVRWCHDDPFKNTVALPLGFS